MAEFQFIDRGYGKYWVKMLHLERNGNVHSIKEYEVSTLITLNSDKDFKQVSKFSGGLNNIYIPCYLNKICTLHQIFSFKGDNSDIIATDSQKNTVYLLAKKHGVGSPEQFAMLVAKHFVQTYSWVTKAEVTVEALNWQRVRGDHVHAFIATPTFTRWAKVTS